MEADASDRVISRKARTAREGFEARAMSPAKALRLALAKAADATMDLALAVTTLEQSQVSRGELIKTFAAPGLLILIEGARRGAARLDSGALASIIEQQTIGRVTDRAIGERPVTRTDAALVASFLDDTLSRLAGFLSDQEGAETWRGYEYGAMLENAHDLDLSLESEEFHLFRVSTSLADGMRLGLIEIALPVVDLPPEERDGEGAAPERGRALASVVVEATVTFDAVLDRVSMPIDEVMKLAVGNRVPLDIGPDLLLRVEGVGRHLVSGARLGQMNGARAVRLVSSETPRRSSGRTDGAGPMPPPVSQTSDRAATEGAVTASKPNETDPAGTSALADHEEDTPRPEAADPQETYPLDA
ncbi:FliM/FliN family flagellar motor C-terminal domain-containing protein [Roseovarius sp. SCSIO 43702]|uniref:FliM/FliN family flagellar motor switch protein n=1 Tax=Roseovarius sp. SCSIO 43702 TaxID=2823043 RepID=UPI001C72FB23|nr:FliM/FliN family flagellar motor C-terminal domain-containing protein [Roseovarius sp. SCSIO 43702]QYX56046.1 FliM/FliN family flagellar motor C-terminal domain-containing protein [Roseovarius sp. SCSIO 43702]